MRSWNWSGGIRRTVQNIAKVSLDLLVRCVVVPSGHNLSKTAFLHTAVSCVSAFVFISVHAVDQLFHIYSNFFLFFTCLSAAVFLCGPVMCSTRVVVLLPLLRSVCPNQFYFFSLSRPTSTSLILPQLVTTDSRHKVCGFALAASCLSFPF